MSPSTMRAPGLDVSHHQGRIAWNRAKIGHEYVYVKSSEGVGFTDGRFQENARKAAEQGLAVGLYHFSYPKRARQAYDEAAFFKRHIDSVSEYLTLPPALDVESVYDATKRMSPQAIADYTVELAHLMENQFGMPPIIYTGNWYLQSYMARDPRLARWPLWISSYQTMPPPAPAPWDDYVIWQYTASARVDGIIGNVDKNLANREWLAEQIGESEMQITIPDELVPVIVEGMYELVALRTPDEKGRQYWVDTLTNAADATALLYLFHAVLEERKKKGWQRDGNGSDLTVDKVLSAIAKKLQA